MAMWDPGLDVQVDLIEDRMAGGAHAHPFQDDRDAHCRASGRGEAGWIGGNGGFRFVCVSLFRSPQGFQEAEGDIALGGVLPSHERHLLAQD